MTAAGDLGAVVIRPCAVAEVDAVLELWRVSGTVPSATDDAETVAGLVGRPDSWLLVADEAGHIVGSLIAAWDGWRGSFYRLAVSPEWRRRGIASALVRAGEALLVAAGARRLSAIVLLGHLDAAGFWEAAGYSVHGGAGRFTKTL